MEHPANQMRERSSGICPAGTIEANGNGMQSKRVLQGEVLACTIRRDVNGTERLVLTDYLGPNRPPFSLNLWRDDDVEIWRVGRAACLKTSAMATVTSDELEGFIMARFNDVVVQREQFPPLCPEYVFVEKWHGLLTPPVEFDIGVGSVSEAWARGGEVLMFSVQLVRCGGIGESMLLGWQTPRLILAVSGMDVDAAYRALDDTDVVDIRSLLREDAARDGERDVGEESFDRK